MDRRTQAPQGAARPGPPPGGGPDPHAHPPQAAQGRPSLSVGPCFARTVGHYFPDLNAWLDAFPDPRRQASVEYHRRCLAWCGILLFAGKLGSRRQFDFSFREAGSEALANLNRLAGTAQAAVPCNDTLDDWLAQVGAAPVAGLRARMIGRLARMRVLDKGRVQGRLVAAVDGSGFLSFGRRHCPHCLTRTHGEATSYSHQVLEAKILGPARTAFSLGTEFIDNRHLQDTPAKASEQKRKQDCELVAARRLLAGIRQDFPQAGLCLTADALYACGAGWQMARDFNCSLVAVFKEGSLPALWQEFQALLRALGAQNRLQTRGEDGWQHEYRWVDLPYTDSEGRGWELTAIRYEGQGPGGERSQWAWLASADLRVDAATVEELAWEVGRARWREENQGFNIQKNSGLAMEHAYSQGEHFGAYYLLLQVAHLLLQLLEKGSLLSRLAQEAGKPSAVALLGSLKNIAAFLVESLRNLCWPEEAFRGGNRLRISLDSG
jgi:hypothetical protein